MNNNLPTIHGYVRVSSDDQAKNGFSLETQQKLVLEFMQRAAKAPAKGAAAKGAVDAADDAAPAVKAQK